MKTEHCEFNKTQTIKYLIFTFGVAWAIQIGVALFYYNGMAMVGQLLMAAMMFVPLLGVLVSGHPLKGMGWRPTLKRNILPFLTAWFSPAVLTALGALMYFLLFPSHFDLSGQALAESVGTEALRQMEAQGITYPVYVVISIVQALTYAPFLNMFLAVGEEAGWRGFLYPQIKARFGEKTGRITGGVIWGLWHAPAIGLIGYEYGFEYFGFPVLGILLFCVITVALGIICDWLYDRSGCIWLPSLFHGAFNAAATVPLAVIASSTGSTRLLGPVPNGLIAGIPLLAFALILFVKTNKKNVGL